MLTIWSLASLVVIAISAAQDFPFRNPNLTLEARVEDLLLRLSTFEIVSISSMYNM